MFSFVYYFYTVKAVGCIHCILRSKQCANAFIQAEIPSTSISTKSIKALFLIHMLFVFMLHICYMNSIHSCCVTLASLLDSFLVPSSSLLLFSLSVSLWPLFMAVWVCNGCRHPALGLLQVSWVILNMQSTAGKTSPTLQTWVHTHTHTHTMSSEPSLWLYYITRKPHSDCIIGFSRNAIWTGAQQL